tara:strand:+ start:479 stop:673 length:195 start_codon:yes stop_codon:yes gene_type:complete
LKADTIAEESPIVSAETLKFASKFASTPYLFNPASAASGVVLESFLVVLVAPKASSNVPGPKHF